MISRKKIALYQNDWPVMRLVAIQFDTTLSGAGTARRAPAGTASMTRR